MNIILEAESTLTTRYQTTVPEAVRRALNLGKRDKIHYTIRDNGEVVLTRVSTGEDDPVIGQFLDFLARDLAEHPEHVQSLGGNLYRRLQSLTAGVDVDLDEPLPADGE